MTGTIIVNGTRVPVEFDAADTLLNVLRAHDHQEVKSGCASGECGSCIVLVDDILVNSCQIFAATVLEKEVTTSTGLNDGGPHTIHDSFADTGAVQCGFCTPGMVMATYSLLKRTPKPTQEEIQEALVGNLCRCTGYVKIFDAVRLASERMAENG